ncbi:MAG TPA: SRPBCC family protein [Gaiellaceae bacterium]|nr:SRPBCC family protein [Gaiellaceae bacterium]
MAEAMEEAKDAISSSGDDAGSRVAGLASKGKIVPALATAAAAGAAGLAAAKGPGLVKKLKGQVDDQAQGLGKKALAGATQRAGSSGGLMGKAASKLIGGGSESGGDDDGGGGKKTRRLPIQRWTDVAVPVEKAYEAWTNFEEYPEFMHRVLDVSQDGDDKIHWQEKIWFSTRDWDGEIVERRENDRVAWKTISGTQHSGIVSFHKLDDNLTRVMVDVDFLPSGMIEKMASGLRFVKRAVEADLARFKAYVELSDIDELEYSSKPAEIEQYKQSEEDSGDEGESDDARSSADEDSNDEERESERQERESRREERRNALSPAS